MHTHPVILHWKGENGTLHASINRLFDKDKKGEEVLELCKSQVEDFVRRAPIFAFEPGRGKGIRRVPTDLVVGLKTFKIAKDADNRRPLTLLRYNNGKEPVLFCRPYPDNSKDLLTKVGLVFKLKPLNSVLLLLVPKELHEVIDRHNAEHPMPETLVRKKGYHPLNTNEGQEQFA